MKKFILILSLVCLCGLSALAQDIKVRGTVIDETNQPMIGASVIQLGTTNGVITDIDGKYEIIVPQGTTLQYSSIGFVSQDIVANSGVINVTLKEDVRLLDEVVVVGYGVQKRSSVTGAITSVASSDIENRTITDVAESLGGKTPGVMVISNSAAPGSSPTIRVRGYSSNGDSNPLYVVDGLRTTDISNIDPADIESIEVLKDAASAAIYGAQAGNGVLLITTKKAKKGRTRISYDFQLSFQSLGKVPEVLNSEEYITYMLEGNLIDQATFDKYWDGVTDTDWMDETFETSVMQKHNLSVMGANDNGSFMVSLTYLDNDGMVVGDSDTFRRFSGTVNADYKIRPWLKVGTNNTFSTINIESVAEQNIMGSIMLSAIQLDPLTPVTYSADNLPDTMQAYLDAGRTLIQADNGDYYSISPYGDSNNINPHIIINRGKDEKSVFVLNGTTYADITPFKDLVFTTRLGYRYSSRDDYSYTFPNVVCSDNYQDYVSIDAAVTKKTYYQWENFANYTHTFAKNHNFGAMIGMSYSYETAMDVTAGINGTSSGSDIDLGITKLDTNYAYFDYQTGTAVKTVSGGEKREYTSLSYFGRLSYDYKEKYFFQFSLRADAADLSILPMNKRWGYFPAVSGGWVLSKENFLKDVDWLSHLKIRASWGQNGSISGLSDYLYASVITTDVNYAFSSDATYSTGSHPSSTGNYDLKWETSEQIDIGLDTRFFNERLGFSMDWYNKKTKDLIVTGITPSLIVGNTVSPMNAGNVRNRGWEFDASWRDRIGDFEYSVKANLATLDNEVTYLHETLERIASEDYSAGAATMNYFEEGYPVWYMRGYVCTGIDPDTGDPVFEDLNGDGVIGDSDKTMIGSGIPDFTYGITITAAWKGFDLLLFGSGSHGNDVFLAYNRAVRMKANVLTEFYDNRWTAVGDNAKYARPNCDEYTKYIASSKFVFDGSYFKIKQIQLGYTVPKKILEKVKLSNCRVYMSLDDFFTFTKYPGFDPEFMSTGSGMGLDLGSYPSSKKIVFGLNLAF